MTGQHNVANALAAIGAAQHAGVPPRIACEALCTFAGVKRRMECFYDTPGLHVYDDFAHHPTAIRTTLEGLRRKVGSETILAIIELGSHTMRKGTHADTLANAAMAADRVVWFKPANVGWAVDTALKRDNVSVFETIDDIVAAAIAAASSGINHIVIMSNSGFGGLRRRLTLALQAAPPA